jgi:hypothetical protein
MERFGDPGYKYHVAATQFMGLFDRMKNKQDETK